MQCASLGCDGNKVDTPFARYAVMYDSSFMFGKLSAEDLPGADGAYRQLGNYSVSSDAKLVDMAGNADYAIGSLLGGSYTLLNKTSTNLNSSYAVYNPVTALPQSASFTCTPHLTAARNGTTEGSVTGSAKLTIENATAQAEVSLEVTPETGTPTQLDATASFGNGNFEMSNSSGIHVGLGAAANGGFVIVAPWKAVFAPSNITYWGVAAFTCE